MSRTGWLPGSREGPRPSEAPRRRSSSTPSSWTTTAPASPPARPRAERAMAQVTLRNLVKDYDQTPAVRGIDLDIADKEFVVLVGPSGCGKTTTLRMIAGLEDITGGEILIGGDVVNDVPPKDRDIAMVFQNYALYPHMTVHENMSFGLRLKKLPKDEIARRVAAVAGILGIGELLDRKPKQLSGGQRQRVAMG